MRFVFGPVPSRRLGQSLGVDPVPPKTCNWNCVYCQIGHTTGLHTERQDFFPPDDILAEIRGAVAAAGPDSVDWITFVGSGETALCSSLGRLIREVKGMTDIPVAVITNGSLLHLPSVRDELCAADAVLPTVDAGSEGLFRRINRPHRSLSLDQLVRGLVDFRREYTGNLWVEVMLIRGLNDTEEALEDIARILRQVQPDRVHLSLPSRPPSETWVQLPDAEGLTRAARILGTTAQVPQASAGDLQLSGAQDLEERIVDIVSRHPISESELRRAIERWNRGQVDEALASLTAGGRIQVVERHGERFWSSPRYRYTERCSPNAGTGPRHRD